VRLLLLAALAGEHLLLLGPPGTAKSELSRRMARLTGGTYFERLLTRFSVPEELFGPLSMKGMYMRNLQSGWSYQVAWLNAGCCHEQRNVTDLIRPDLHSFLLMGS
jgi:hypothetical protein